MYYKMHKMIKKKSYTNFMYYIKIYIFKKNKNKYFDVHEKNKYENHQNPILRLIFISGELYF